MTAFMLHSVGILSINYNFMLGPVTMFMAANDSLHFTSCEKPVSKLVQPSCHIILLQCIYKNNNYNLHATLLRCSVGTRQSHGNISVKFCYNVDGSKHIHVPSMAEQSMLQEGKWQ